MKKIIRITIIISLLLLNISCKDKTLKETITSEVNNSMKVIINNHEYNVNLENNQTTKELLNKLPLKLNMNELNGNEKYYYLDFNLPTLPSNPKTIYAGDIMLYQNNCIVLFYKTFDTSYSYTKIGQIDNLEELNGDNITVEFK
ncbi:MAG: hypothetical protein E7159_01335 [Firmicutes bacterium]|nr:hypothetical protein [Bacillota bacterium]